MLHKKVLEIYIGKSWNLKCQKVYEPCLISCHHQRRTWEQWNLVAEIIRNHSGPPGQQNMETCGPNWLDGLKKGNGPALMSMPA